MKQRHFPDRIWASLREALEQECTGMAGYGQITIRLTFHNGEPRSMAIVAREPSYRFDVDRREAGGVE